MKFVISLLLFVNYALSATLQQPLASQDDVFVPPKVAIIGAGAGGSSAAYHLQKFTSGRFNITIFERNSYVGGRSTTIGNYDPGYPYDIELGGAVFVTVNKILVESAKKFNLTLQELGSFSKIHGDVFQDSIGIWNGTDFTFTTSKQNNSYWLLAKLLWKYKLSPIRVYLSLKKFVRTFIQEYYENHFPLQGLNEVNKVSGFDHVTNQTGEEFLLGKGVGTDFLHELLETVTRVNYRSNLDDIHGLEALVSVAADEKAYRVKGGNFLIFENFIKASNASLKLNTDVLQLSKQGSLWNVTYQSNNDDTNTHSELFDHVVLASPFNQTSIAFDDSISIPREVEYRELYVTFIQTNRTQQLNHAIFKHYSIPEQILTTSPTDSIPFFSINLVDYDKESDKIIYKIFSPIPIDYQYLENFLFDEKQTDWNHVKIIFSKLWKPYPHLIPISTFDDFLIGENFWYLNTIESFISTMETAAFAGANVAGLISIGQNTTDIKL